MTLSGLITNLLDVSRVQAGALAVSCSPVSIADVILPALDELGFGPADVELAVADDLPLILADPGLLQRVLVNLLENAQRFSPLGCPVRVSASRFGGTVEIRVVDSGPGVASDRRDDILCHSSVWAIPTTSPVSVSASRSPRDSSRGWGHPRCGRYPRWRPHDGDLASRRGRERSPAASGGAAVRVAAVRRADSRRLRRHRCRGYLRLYLAQLRKKLEPAPSRPAI